MASSSKPTRVALAAAADGWRRVAMFPLGLVALAAAIALVTLPAAVTVRMAIERHLGSSLTASEVAAGVNLDWWHEFAAAGGAAGFTPAIIGGAAPVGTYSELLDGYGPPAALAATVLAAALLWLFLSGGLLDRYARRRRVGTRGFFGACGVFFFRFLRLGLMTAVAYAVLVGPVHGWWFGVYDWLTRETSVERTALLWRVVFYAVWLTPVLLVNLLVDYAKARAVLEDRHSMVGALAAAARFLRRHAAEALVVYGLTAAAAAVVLLAYVLLAPDGRGGDWRLVAVFSTGGLYLLARLATRLAFLASALALIERRLAHAEYTAAPLPVWPDSPAAEAIDNAAIVAGRQA
jgi:hypothetical protein